MSSLSPSASLKILEDAVRIVDGSGVESGGVDSCGAEVVGGEVADLDRLEDSPRDGLANTNLNVKWWRRPSPWWLLITAPLLTIAFSATIAPRLEIYTIAACREYRRGPVVQDFGRGAGVGVVSSSFGAVAILQNFASGLGVDEDIPCASDPAVQAAAAQLIAVITTTMGVLTCMTTGFWGSFSDRHGRTRVMAISLAGALIADLVYILFAHLYNILPGGSWFLLIAPIGEGLMGGSAAGEAALQSYMADVTDEGSRSRFFSLMMGLMLVGVAAGPTLGSLLIGITHDTISVFYFVAVLHALLVFWALALLPESVSKEMKMKSREKYRDEVGSRGGSVDSDSDSGSGSGSRGDGGASDGWMSGKIHMVLPFLRPLAVFLPYQSDTGTGNTLKNKKRDWSLTFLALGFGGTVAVMGCYPYKLQYAAAVFHWGAVEQGYFIGLVGLTSGVFLVLVFPIITKFFKPKPIIIETPNPTQPHIKIKKEIHSPAFDLHLIKMSLIVNIGVYIAIGVFTSAVVFTVMGMLGSVGLGIGPALQSVALVLYTRQGGTEVGKLFGGLGVVTAIGSQFFGPFFYGVIYAKTVALYPRTIFFVCAGSLMLALVFVSLIRIPVDEVLDLEEREPLLGNSQAEMGDTTYGATCSRSFN